MKLLTGQCKIDFEKWLNQTPSLTGEMHHFRVIIGLDKFKDLSLSMQFGVFVDFFDSVDIDVSNKRNQNGYFSRVNGLTTYKKPGTIKGYKTRNESMRKAIKQANETYNKLSIMELTGHCKIDFEKWFETQGFGVLLRSVRGSSYQEVGFYDKPQSMQYGVLVDFFGEYKIHIGNDSPNEFWVLTENNIFFNPKEIDYITFEKLENRKESIKQANKIYNGINRTM